MTAQRNLRDEDNDGFRRFVDRVQELIVGFEGLAPEERIAATVRAWESIPAVTRQIERMLLIAVTLEVAVRLVHTLHRRIPRRRQLCSCHLLLAQLATAIVDLRVRDHCHCMTAWLSEFAKRYQLAHSGNHASAAAALIRANPPHRWTLDVLAARVGTNRRTLARQFRKMFGTSLHRYLGIARLLAVYDRLNTDDKISAIAAEGGYATAKGFYRITRQCTGLTPRQLRLLAPSDRSRVEQLLKAELAGREATPSRRQQGPTIYQVVDTLEAGRHRAALLTKRIQSIRLKALKATATAGRRRREIAHDGSAD